jgi:hypothetical protein
MMGIDGGSCPLIVFDFSTAFGMAWTLHEDYTRDEQSL